VLNDRRIFRHRRLRPPRADWASTMSVSPRVLLLACVAVSFAAAAGHGVRAATLDPTGYTPTLYVFQNNQLIDV
jgi:hypothetical protein